MDTNPRLRRWLVVGIILLFVDASTTLCVNASCTNPQLPRVMQQQIKAIPYDIVEQSGLVENVKVSSGAGNDYHPRMTTNGLGQPIVVYEQEIDVDYKNVPVVYSADAGHTWTRQFLFDSIGLEVFQYPDIVYNAPNDVLFLSMIDPVGLNICTLFFILGDIANAQYALYFPVACGAEGFFYGACACTNNFFFALWTENCCSIYPQSFGTYWCTYPDFSSPPGISYNFNADWNTEFRSAPAAELEMDSNSNQLFIVCETRLESGTTNNNQNKRHG